MLIRINLDDTYEMISMSPELTEATFNSINKEGKPVLLKIKIEPPAYSLLPNVYNLCFGPPLLDGSIDDEVQISHRDLKAYLDDFFVALGADWFVRLLMWLFTF